MERLSQTVQQLGVEERTHNSVECLVYKILLLILIISHCLALTVVVYDIYHTLTESSRDPIDVEMRMNSTESYINPNHNDTVSV